MESKVCSRSHGHPPSPRSRAMMDTARSKRSPLDGILPDNVNDRERRGNREGPRIRLLQRLSGPCPTRLPMDHGYLSGTWDRGETMPWALVAPGNRVSE